MEDGKTPASPEVLNKYQAAAQIANKALGFAIARAVAGANVSSLCQETDNEIVNLAGKTYNKTKIIKGIALPTSVSINHVLCHFSPTSLDSESSTCLKAGDLVKIELGAHIDGFPALVAHSMVVGATAEAPATGLAADLIKAASQIGDLAIRLIKPGNNSRDMCSLMAKAAAEHNVRFMEGMVSHSVGKDMLAGEKVIIVNPNDAQKKTIQGVDFAEHEVYVIDIALSTGEGKVKPCEMRPTIFRKTETAYSLKLKTSRAVFSKVQSQFGAMAFNIRNLEDERKARVAMNECTTHGLMSTYDVLAEKDETALTARLMFTVALMPGGPLQLTDCQLAMDRIKSERSVSSTDLLQLLTAPVRAGRKKRAEGAMNAPTPATTVAPVGASN